MHDSTACIYFLVFLYSLLVYIFHISLNTFIIFIDCQGKRDGVRRLQAHRDNCKKEICGNTGITLYAMCRHKYRDSVTGRETVSATRETQTSERINAKRVSVLENEKKRGRIENAGSFTVSKRDIKKIKKQEKIMSMCMTEEANIESRLAQNSLGPKHEKRAREYRADVGGLRLLLVQCESNKSGEAELTKEGFTSWMEKTTSFVNKFTSKRDKVVAALQAAEALAQSTEPEASGSEGDQPPELPR